MASTSKASSVQQFRLDGKVDPFALNQWETQAKLASAKFGSDVHQSVVSGIRLNFSPGPPPIMPIRPLASNFNLADRSTKSEFDGLCIAYQAELAEYSVLNTEWSKKESFCQKRESAYKVKSLEYVAYLLSYIGELLQSRMPEDLRFSRPDGDFLRLFEWLRINAIEASDQLPLYDRLEKAEKEFKEVFQRETEDIQLFIPRWNAAKKRFESEVGAHVVWSEERFAARFMKATDSKRFGNEVGELRRLHKHGEDRYPKTIKETQDLYERWERSLPSRKTIATTVSTTTDSTTVMSVVPTKSNPTNTSTKKTTDKKKGSGGAEKSSTTTASGGGVGEKKGDRPCNHCNNVAGAHAWRDCWMFKIPEGMRESFRKDLFSMGYARAISKYPDVAESINVSVKALSKDGVQNRSVILMKPDVLPLETATGIYSIVSKDSHFEFKPGRVYLLEDSGCGINAVVQSMKLFRDPSAELNDCDVGAHTAGGSFQYKKWGDTIFGPAAYNPDNQVCTVSEVVMAQMPGFTFTKDQKKIADWKRLDCDYLDVAPLMMYRYGILYYADVTEWIRAGVFQSRAPSVQVMSAVVSDSMSVDAAANLDTGKYTKKQLQLATEAQQVVNRTWWSLSDLEQQVKFGYTEGIPFNEHDIRLAAKIGDPNISILQGKQTHSDGAVHNLEKNLGENELVVESDLFTTLGLWYLISICIPTFYSVVTCLNTKDEKARETLTVGPALLRHIELFMSHGYVVKYHVADGEGAIGKSHSFLNRLGVHCPTLSKDSSPVYVDLRIRLLKERERCALFYLDEDLPMMLRFWLVRFANWSVNASTTKSNVNGMPPILAFTGLRTNYSDLPTYFGAYVETSEYNGVLHSRTNRSRSLPAIYLGKADTRQSYYLWNLNTFKVIKRSKFTAFSCWPKSIKEYIITHVKCVATDQKVRRRTDDILPDNVVDGEPMSILRPAHTDGESGVSDTADSTAATAIFDPEEQPLLLPIDTRGDSMISSVVSSDALLSTDTDATDIHLLSAASTTDVPATDDDKIIMSETIDVFDPGKATTNLIPNVPSSDIFADIVADDRPVPSSTEPILPRRSERLRKVNPWFADTDSHVYMVQYTPKKAKVVFGIDMAESAIMDQLRVVLKYKTFHPIRRRDVPDGMQVFFSHMFLNEKFFPSGEFEKLKARLVANCAHNLETLFNRKQDSSSPVVKTDSLFITCVLDAVQCRIVICFDVGSAYLRADIKGDVYLRIPADVAELLIRIDPTYADFKEKNGSVVVKLDKALYGCIESSKLWYDFVSEWLLSLGFMVSDRDPCVFNVTTPAGYQCTVVIHVDDGKVSTVDEEYMKFFVNELIVKFGEVKIREGKRHDFLGLILDYETFPQKCWVSQPGLISSMIELGEEHNIIGVAESPAAVNLFEVDIESPLLKEDKKEVFHRLTYQGVYATTRSRPDFGCVTSFLAQRVLSPTEQDWRKLCRFIKYARSTKDLGLILGGDEILNLCIHNFSDAALGSYADGHSHGGSFLSFGTGAVMSKSHKLKTIPLSSTEAELYEATDGAKMSSATLQFMDSMGMDLRPVVFHQDNQSAIRLESVGRSTSFRTSHIRTRYFFMHMLVENGDIRIVYTPTDEMWADILTKPLVGEKFLLMRDTLLGYLSLEQARELLAHSKEGVR